VNELLILNMLTHPYNSFVVRWSVTFDVRFCAMCSSMLYSRGVQ